jgi:hypothetical protein
MGKPGSAYRLGDWVGPRAVWTLWKSDEFLAPAGIWTQYCPVHSLVTIPATVPQHRHSGCSFRCCSPSVMSHQDSLVWTVIILGVGFTTIIMWLIFVICLCFLCIIHITWMFSCGDLCFLFCYITPTYILSSSVSHHTGNFYMIHNIDFIKPYKFYWKYSSVELLFNKIQGQIIYV